MIKLLKKIIKNILFRPLGLKKFGKNSYIKRPFNINEREKISIGSNSFIHNNCEIIMISNNVKKVFNPKLIIGDNIYIGKFFHLHCMSNIVIGNGCVISDNVFISAASHSFDPYCGNIMQQELTFADIVICDNTFIGRNVFIGQGVVLGEHCVVGANSVVTKSFEPYSMIGGIPAKVLKRYDQIKKEWIKIA